MRTSKLSAIEINPSSRAEACIIWLHGLGASGHDFEPVVPYLGLPGSLAVRFVFPHAPKRPVTVNQGYVMPAWYDIAYISINKNIDLTGVRASAEKIHELIEDEIENGIRADRIILAGFSQGGVVALEAGLGFRDRIAGIIGLSTYLADQNSVPAGDLPIFLGHGGSDSVVPISLGQQARDALIKSGYPVEWHQYAMDHSVSMEEIRDIGRWITRRLV